MSKKKILYIHHGWGIGGAPLSLLYLIENLDLSIYEPFVLFLYESDVIELFKNKNISYKILDVDTKILVHSETTWYKWYHIFHLVNPIISSFKVYTKLAKKIYLEEKPDIIHLNSLFLFPWTKAASELNIPIICHVREPLAKGYFGLRQLIIRNILRKSVTKIIAINYDNGNRLNIPEKTDVIYNFVDLEDYSLKKNNTEHDKKYILYLGGHVGFKGFYVLVRSLKYLEDSIVVKFAGYYSHNYNNTKILRNYYLKKMRRANNTDELGVITNVPDEINTCSVVIFPATKPHFARPIIEAGAMKTPVVASNIQGMQELVIDKSTGYLVNPGKPKELALAINKICNNNTNQKRMGIAGFKLVTKLFNSEANVLKTTNVYKYILHK